MPKAWTDDEIKTLRQLYGSMHSSRLAIKLGIARTTLEIKARELALGKNKARFKGKIKMPRWTPEELEMLEELYPTLPSVMVARELGRSVRSVNSKASLMGLSKTVERLTDAGAESAAHLRVAQRASAAAALTNAIEA